MCCKLMGIKEIDKPVNKWCPHAKPGCGCSIYHDKPPSCNVFECLWLQTELGPEYKPDRIKGVLSTLSTGDGLVLYVEPRDYSTIWRKPEIMNLVGSLITNKNKSKFVINDGARTCVLLDDGPNRWKLCQGEFVRFNEKDDTKIWNFGTVICRGRFG